MKTFRLVALLAFLSIAGVSQAGNPYYRHCHPHCRPVVYRTWGPPPAYYYGPRVVVVPAGPVYHCHHCHHRHYDGDRW